MRVRTVYLSKTEKKNVFVCVIRRILCCVPKERKLTLSRTTRLK